jgi:hypothetical protein
MWCPRCGSETDDTARFCSTCGMDLTTYQQLWHDTGSQTPDQATEASQSGGPLLGPATYPAPQTHQAPQYRPPASQGAQPHVPSYLGWAIAVLILCFWPTAIAAIVYASQVDSKLSYGDIEGAWESSRKAKRWCWISFGIAVGLFAVILIIAA